MKKRSPSNAKSKRKPVPGAKPTRGIVYWPQSDVLHELNLDGLIHHLERIFIESHPAPEAAEKLLATIREASRRVSSLGQEASNRDRFNELSPGITDEMPDQQTFSEKLGDLLPVVWADYRLWQVFARKPPESAVLKNALFAYSLLKFYNLKIPFRDAVWLELRMQPAKWNYLQCLMIASGASYFFHLEAASPRDELTDGERALLNEMFLGKLLQKYVAFPLNDWRPLVWRMRYPPQVLRRLNQAARSLAKDAAWCAKNPDRYIARKAPIAGHRVRSLRDVKAVEEMVVILCREPGMSDYALAKEGMGRITAAGRKLAKEAKLLALHRNGVPIKSHKSRGDNNAPTGPA